LKIEEYFAFPLKKLLGHLLAAHAKRFGGGIEIETVTALVLDLSQQCRLAAQRRRACDPVAFRQHADDFGMRMLADLADQRAAIAFRHLVGRFDFFFAVDPCLEGCEKLFRFRGA
jgi:hypothetical protein